MAVVWQASPTGLDLEFYIDANALLVASPYSWYVTAGYRTIEQQAALYAKYEAGGPLAAPPGMSAHNHRLAIDVVLDGSDKPGLQMLWDIRHAGWLWLRAKIAAHPRLHSLWKVGDWPHCQSTLWKGGRFAGTPDWKRITVSRPIVGVVHPPRPTVSQPGA